MAINGTLELIDSVTVGSGGAASIEFTSIPQTYSDLILKVSCRGDVTATTFTSLRLLPNGSSSNGSTRWIRGNGAAASSDTDATGIYSGESNTNGATANTFSSFEWYIPNYAGSTYKSFSIDSVHEQNGTTAYQHLVAGLWSNTAAITSITLNLGAGSFVEHSTAYLYGVSRVPAGAKATGGVIYSDSNYWYHTFPYSGVFTPLENLTVDYLVVAGGGAGGNNGSFGSDGAGGGGAGGLRSTVTATGGGGSLESALSLTASNNYTITIGAGGAGRTGGDGRGSAGSNSVFSTITSTGGGGGGGYTQEVGGSGGSGGGAGWYLNSASGAGTRTASPIQGYDGGNAPGGGVDGNGGGGGAGGAGQPSSNLNNGGNGGLGLAVAITGSSVTYAGGGGGAGDTTSGVGGTGGSGVGGAGATTGASSAGNGVVNTGSGGGGAAAGNKTSGAGGSGIVIVRYAK